MLVVTHVLLYPEDFTTASAESRESRKSRIPWKKIVSAGCRIMTENASVEDRKLFPSIDKHTHVHTLVWTIRPTVLYSNQRRNIRIVLATFYRILHRNFVTLIWLSFSLSLSIYAVDISIYSKLHYREKETHLPICSVRFSQPWPPMPERINNFLPS